MLTAGARQQLGAALAAAFLAGAWTESALVRRGAEALHPRPRWLPALARDVLAAYHRPPADRPRELAAFVAHLLHGLPYDTTRPRVRRWFSPAPAMARMPWPVPPIARPKLKLKEVQRSILREILDRIPPHDAAHGFVRGRSARTHARLHAGRHTVVRMDLEDFFTSVPASRVYGIFRTAGYPEAVAHALTALSTTVVPRDEWAAVPLPDEPDALRRHLRLGRRLATPHLPQGAPTSPALASLAATHLDRRLAALAPTLCATYSRYADDLAFSGPADLPAGTLRRVVAELVREEGFRVVPAKTSVRRRHERQLVTGVVVNTSTNVERRSYDRLKAVLHDAAVNGPGHANRDGVPDFRAHLQGRVAWVAQLNPRRGRRLQAALDAIAW